MDKFMKDLIKIFKEFSLSVTVTTNLTTFDFRDGILNLKTGKHYPWRKVNKETVVIHRSSNHLTPGINRRIFKLSLIEIIYRATLPYNDALVRSGFTEELNYMEDS